MPRVKQISLLPRKTSPNPEIFVSRHTQERERVQSAIRVLFYKIRTTPSLLQIQIPIWRVLGGNSMARIKPQALLQQSKKKKAPNRISVTTIILFGLIVVMVLFFIFSTYRHFSHRPVDSIKNIGRKVLPDLKNSDVPRYAIIHTSKGQIAVELFKEGSPEIVDEFIELCQNGHFKGMQFSRVIKHYVIQAGDVHGAAEEWTSGGKNQLDRSVKHEAFMLGTSRTKHENRGFELYITTAPIPDLNDKINVFGRVVKGEDVVQEIEEVDTDDHYIPKSAIGISDVTLQRKI